MATKGISWRNYVTDNGDFELPTFLFRLLNDLMKASLDLGTLLSNDATKTRAYKEQVKKVFKDRWSNLAQALEYFDLIVPCSCSHRDFCDICGGSRYLLNHALSPDAMREVATFTTSADPDLDAKLQAGLVKAMYETGNM